MAMLGKTISHYRITEQLGKGGMGVVYKAIDTSLDREVALKFLPRELGSDEDAKSRFIHEAKTASALDHPNVCTIHEIGETDDGQLFIAMAYYSGESLTEKIKRGALPIEDALDYTVQAAEGLKRAHEKGIVHRDVKPANLMVTEERVVKVVDFGIAKMTSGTHLTRTGSTIGTTTYMSPEQARGDQVDQRTDIWSLGATLYEMLSGERPFRGEYEPAVVYSILNEDPEFLSALRPDVPATLEKLVEKALSKKADKRFQSMDEMIEALNRTRERTDSGLAASARVSFRLGRKERALLTRGAVAFAIVALGLLVWLWVDSPEAGLAPELQNIVVLPFENLGPADDIYFAAGMTDEITSRLGRVSGLRVISRRSALRYEGTTKDDAVIGAELGVGYILSGSVRWAEGGSGRVRITPELIRISDDTQVWSESYDRVIEDIFQVQTEISGQVIRQLGITLLEGEQTSLRAQPTENMEAYRLYLKGRYFWERRTKENIDRALSYYEQAVELDPGYAKAYVGIAETWIFHGWYSRLAPKETFPRAIAAVERALEFDDLSAEAHTARGHLYLEYDHDWAAAEREYLRAIELNPEYPQVHHWYGGFLSAMGRHDEAMEQALTASRLDPLSMIINTWVGLRHYFALRFDAAIREYESALDLNPHFAPGHWHLGWALEQVGRYAEAISHAQQAIDISEGNLLYVASLGHAYAIAGRTEEARAILDQLDKERATRHVSAYHVAVILGALGDIDKAFAWLDRAVDERSPWIGYMGVDPRIGTLREDSRLDMFFQRANLVL